MQNDSFTGNNKILLIVGHSGSGKDTILNILVDEFKMNPIVSYTTRPMRHYETNGVQYHFIDRETFKEMISNGDMAEYVEYRDWLYGTVGKDLIDNSVLIVEPHGLEQLKQNSGHFDLDLYVLFVDVPEQVRKNRLSLRGDDPQEIERRIRTDRDLFKDVECDYILVNDTNDMYDLFSKVFYFYHNFYKED